MGPGAIARGSPAWETEFVTTSGSRDGQVRGQHGSNRPPALRPRRLVGRDCEIVEVSERIALAPLTTVTGPGGVGKTALALAVADAVAAQFPGGVFVVWLAPLRSEEHIAGEVAAQVGMPRSGGQPYEDSLTQWLADRDVLLLLDNCEHVISAVADLVEGLTSRLPRLRVLATSREPLWTLDELSYRLAPLAVVDRDATPAEIDASPAVRLFRERAGTKAQVSLDTDHAGWLLGEICRRVDGLPLAIELAAARVTGLELEDISLHLDDLFGLLPQTARRADGAQRSLRATVEWSDALLTVEDRQLLRRMAVFAGGFDLAAIKVVCGSDGQTSAEVANVTARLVEKSLLLKEDNGQYHLLETIRQYVAEQLDGAGEIDAIRERHARYYFGVALRESAATVTGPEQTHLETLRRIEDNTRIALETLITIAPQSALELAGSLNFFWWTQGRLREGIGWLERARDAAPHVPAEVRAKGLFSQAFLVAHDTDDWKAAARLVDAGSDALVGVSEPPLILGMLHSLRGECDVFNGDPKAGVVHTQIGLEISARYPGTWGRGYCLWNAGCARLAVGDEDAAIALLTEEIDLCRAHGYGVGEMAGCNVLGDIWEASGALDTAGAYWERALHLRREAGAVAAPTLMWSLPSGHAHGTMPSALLAVARVAEKQGDLATASALLREGLPLAEEMREAATAEQIVELLRKLSQVEGEERATLRPESGVWHIAFNGTSVHLPDLKGLWHLRELVSRPHQFVPALALIGASSEEPVPQGDTGPVLDREALRAYRRRLAELDDDLDDAAIHGHEARQAKRTAERDALIAELKRATGLGGRPRRSGSPAEKARLNVTRTIRHAIAELSTKFPELAEHLDASILTGLSCCYQPLTNIVWTT